MKKANKKRAKQSLKHKRIHYSKLRSKEIHVDDPIDSICDQAPLTQWPENDLMLNSQQDQETQRRPGLCDNLRTENSTLLLIQQFCEKYFETITIVVFLFLLIFQALHFFALQASACSSRQLVHTSLQWLV